MLELPHYQNNVSLRRSVVNVNTDGGFCHLVGDMVKIDGKGLGEVIELVPRGFAWFYFVKICGSDFQVELEEHRVTVVQQTAPAPAEIINETGTETSKDDDQRGSQWQFSVCPRVGK